MWNWPKKKTTMEKNLNSCSQNSLFLINKLLISNKWQKISRKLGANFNTNTSKTTACVFHHIYCASLTKKACARGEEVLGEIGAHALSFINSATQESWEEDGRPTPAMLNHRSNKHEKRETSHVFNNTKGAKVQETKEDLNKWWEHKGHECERKTKGQKWQTQKKPAALLLHLGHPNCCPSLSAPHQRLDFFFFTLHWKQRNTMSPSLSFYMLPTKWDNATMRSDEEEDAKSWGRNFKLSFSTVAAEARGASRLSFPKTLQSGVKLDWLVCLHAVSVSCVAQ